MTKQLTGLPQPDKIGSLPPSSRFAEIDGIRGWAALIVVLFHLFYETFGVVHPELRRRSFFFLFDGELAVFVFFVLSGDALSIGYLTTGRRTTIDRLLAKRYFRLTIPILMVCIITYLLMKAGLTYNIQAAAIVHRDDWLGAMIHFLPHLQPMGRYALYGVYAQHSLQTSYNPFMWTMSIELIGSLLVFAFLYLSPSLRKPTLTAFIIAVALYLVNSWFALFFAGIVFGYLRQRGFLARWHINVVAQIASGVALLATIAAITAADRMGSDTQTGFYINEIFAIMLVGSIYINHAASKFFRLRVSRLLGAISFPLYLIQFCVLVSYTSWMITQSPILSLSRSLIIAGSSTIVCILAAVPFYQVEKLMLTRLDRIIRRFLHNPDSRRPAAFTVRSDS